MYRSTRELPHRLQRGQDDGTSLCGFCALVLILLALAPSTPGRAQSRPLLSFPGVQFGSVVIGSVGTQQVTVTNNSHRTVTVSAIQTSGAPFSYAGVNLPVTLYFEQSFSLTVEFSPTSTGAFNGTLTLNKGKSTQATASLSGTGTAAPPQTGDLSLSPTTLSFGNVTIGDYASLPVNVTNTGTSSVTISSDSVSGAGFTLSNLNLPQTLNAGQGSSFTVTFTPSGTGTSSGSASLTSNAQNSPSVESLSGAGVYSHYVNLSWTASTSQDVTGYNVYRGTNSGGPYSEITTSPVSETSYTDSDVAAGATYYYVATAVSGIEESGYSNQATAVVPSP